MEPITITEGATRFTANAYLVEGETTALVDVGTPSWIGDAIAEQVDRLDAVYLTHSHHDHIEQLDQVIDRFSPAIYAYGELESRTHEVADGDQIQLGDTTMTVLHSPGHADDHVVYYDDRWLFSGDIVVYNDGAFDDGSFGRTDIPGADREILLESIDRMIETIPTSVQAMYPGHGEVYTGDVFAVINRAYKRASRREPKYPE